MPQKISYQVYVGFTLSEKVSKRIESDKMHNVEYAHVHSFDTEDRAATFMKHQIRFPRGAADCWSDGPFQKIYRNV